MNIHSKNIYTIALVISSSILLSDFAYADKGHGHSSTKKSEMEASMTDGEVRKVDLEGGKVTIKHGEIKHLEMPGMTMVFTAKESTLLTNIKAGDKIKFKVINENGKFIVTEVVPTK